MIDSTRCDQCGADLVIQMGYEVTGHCPNCRFSTTLGFVVDNHEHDNGKDDDRESDLGYIIG